MSLRGSETTEAISSNTYHRDCHDSWESPRNDKLWTLSLIPLC